MGQPLPITLTARRSPPSLGPYVRALMVALLALLAVFAQGCSASLGLDNDSTDEMSADALVNCAGVDVVYRVRTSARAWESPGGDAIRGNRSSGIMTAGALLVRKDQRIDDALGVTWLYVKPASGDGSAVTGWVDARELDITTPDSGACADGRDPTRNMSAAERESASTTSLGPVWLDSTVQCVAGLGDGITSEGSELVTGLQALVHSLPAIGQGAAQVLKSALEQQRNLILASLGNETAIQSVKDSAAADLTRLRAALAGIAHAITVVRNYLDSQYLYFSELPVPAKTKYVCSLLGRLTFEVVLQIVTSGTISAVRAGVQGSGLAATTLDSVRSVNRIFSETAEVPNRVGSVGLVYAQQQTFVDQFATKLEALRTATDANTKKGLLRWFSGQGNPLFDLKRVGGGNCGYAAIATIFSIASGRPTCPMPYVADELTRAANAPTAGSIEAFKAEVAKLAQEQGRSAPRFPLGRNAEMAYADAAQLLDSQLSEGQFALLLSMDPTSGHAAAILKIDGQLTVVNNLSWNRHAGEDILQTFANWDATWRAASRTDQVTYNVMITDFALPQ